MTPDLPTIRRVLADLIDALDHADADAPETARSWPRSARTFKARALLSALGDGPALPDNPAGPDANERALANLRGAILLAIGLDAIDDADMTNDQIVTAISVGYVPNEAALALWGATGEPDGSWAAAALVDRSVRQLAATRHDLDALRKDRDAVLDALRRVNSAAPTSGPVIDARKAIAPLLDWLDLDEAAGGRHEGQVLVVAALRALTGVTT